MVTKESISAKFYFMCGYGGSGPQKALSGFGVISGRRAGFEIQQKQSF